MEGRSSTIKQWTNGNGEPEAIGQDFTGQSQSADMLAFWYDQNVDGFNSPASPFFVFGQEGCLSNELILPVLVLSSSLLHIEDLKLLSRIFRPS